MECKVDDYGENRKSYRSSQVELGPISEWTMDDGENDARFWLYVIPKIKASSLKLPTLPENPDVDGAKWILIKTGTESEALAEMQRIIETKLKQSRDVANIVTDLVDYIEEHDDKWIYLSGLIVQDKSMKVKGLIREGRTLGSSHTTICERSNVGRLHRRRRTKLHGGGSALRRLESPKSIACPRPSPHQQEIS